MIPAAIELQNESSSASNADVVAELQKLRNEQAELMQLNIEAAVKSSASLEKLEFEGIDTRSIS